MQYKYIYLSLAVVAVVSSALVFMAATDRPTTSFATVPNPETPKTIELCGQKIDMDRTDMWERFDREITQMVYAHGLTMLTLKRANKYFPRMAPILKKNGIPEDMLYLAAIESNMDQRAISPAKAAGLWQFMPSTAPSYGMEVNDEVDERYNIEKATEGACKYFKQAYGKYGNWESVMASYNAGQGRISGEMQSQGVDSSFDLYLVSETTRYVFRVMAMKAIMQQPRTFGFTLREDQLYQPVDFEEVKVSGPVASWPAWAREHGITYAQLVEANPWIRAKKLTNAKRKTYTVLVPKPDSLSRSKQKKSVFNPAWVGK